MGMQSEQINELAKALAKAQGAMSGAKADSNNPFFKSKYADLESVWTAIRKPFADNDLSVVQTVTFDTTGSVLNTILMHGSGQWIMSTMPVKAKDDSAQAFGSGLSYARRYSLAAIAGVYQSDDDGNMAQGLKQTVQVHPPQAKSADAMYPDSKLPPHLRK